MTRKVRLDVLLVERGLAASRERARAIVLAGRVRVDGSTARKAGDMVRPDTDLQLVEPDHPYVSRGGVKLAYALDAFGIDPAGRTALDIGASTGGFTDVLLRRGAAHVIALDVGHGQLDWQIRSDARVTVLERVNARTLRPDQLPQEHVPVTLVTIDVSFISLKHVLPAVGAIAAHGADVVALVKPQFEAGRSEVGKHGVVRDPAVHERVVRDVADAAASVGFHVRDRVPSPIEGAEGNREFFLHLTRR
jgi:23S rRNA (cytidine1920-2'-O)/16S rRNA (cytidine1409-2'-O)-methyltransferase